MYDLVILSGYAEWTVRDWYYGKAAPSWSAIANLAQALETETAAFLDFTPPKPPLVNSLTDSALLLDLATDLCGEVVDALGDVTTISEVEEVYDRLIDLQTLLRGGAPL